LLFLFLTIELFSQTDLVISEIRISNLYPNLTDSTYNEDEEAGPSLSITCYISNKSHDTLKIFPSESWILCSFKYRGITYQKDMYALPFGENDSIQVTPESKTDFFITTNIFYGTPLWELNKEDYSIELLETLPTIKIYYQDPINKLYSSEIQKVSIE